MLDLDRFRLFRYLFAMRLLFLLWASSALVAASVVLESNIGALDASSSRFVHDAVPLGSRSPSSSVSLNAFLAQLALLFPFDVLVQNAADLTLLAQSFIATVWDISTTRDAILCADVTIVFARGTNEAGNVGVLVGPEFFDAVAIRLAPGKTMAVQGVNYPASIPGFLQGGDPLGSQQMFVPPPLPAPMDVCSDEKGTGCSISIVFWEAAPTPTSSCPDTPKAARSYTIPPAYCQHHFSPESVRP